MPITIGYGQQLHCENVVSRYYMIDSDQFQQTFTDFLTVLKEAGYTPAAGFFYAVLTSPGQSKDMIVQTFLPVNEVWKDDLPEQYRFQSYFQVNGLLATRVVGEEEAKFDAAVAVLLNEMVDSGVEPVTPPFYVVTMLEGKAYTDIMVGVREGIEEDRK